MVKEEKTVRLFYRHKNNHTYGSGTPTNLEYYEVIGYAEVRKGYSLESCDYWTEFKEYIENHQAVFYYTWFEDRIEFPDEL